MKYRLGATSATTTEIAKKVAELKAKTLNVGDVINIRSNVDNHVMFSWEVIAVDTYRKRYSLRMSTSDQSLSTISAADFATNVISSQTLTNGYYEIVSPMDVTTTTTTTTTSVSTSSKTKKILFIGVGIVAAYLIFKKD